MNDMIGSSSASPHDSEGSVRQAGTRLAPLELVQAQKAVMIASEEAQQCILDRLLREAADENVAPGRLLAAAAHYCRMPRPAALGRMNNRYPAEADLLPLGLSMPQALAVSRKAAEDYALWAADVEVILARAEGRDGDSNMAENGPEEDAAGNPLWISISVPDSAEALRKEREALRQRGPSEEVPLPAHLRDTRMYRRRHKDDEEAEDEPAGKVRGRNWLSKVLRMLALGAALAGTYLLFRKLGWFFSH